MTCLPSLKLSVAQVNEQKQIYELHSLLVMKYGSVKLDGILNYHFIRYEYNQSF